LFQLKRANINDHPKQLFSILSAIIFGNFSIFLIFTCVNSTLLNKLEQSFEVSTGIMLINGVNTLTYTIYKTGHLMTMFIIYFRLKILKKFAASLLQCDDENLVKNLKFIGQIWDTICDGLDVIKFCYTINTSYYVISYIFNFVLSVHSVVSYLFYENSTNFDMIYMLLFLGPQFSFLPFFSCLWWQMKSESKRERLKPSCITSSCWTSRTRRCWNK
jgi:hypothetical protein